MDKLIPFVGPRNNGVGVEVQERKGGNNEKDNIPCA
jgi:hypothetical protein